MDQRPSIVFLAALMLAGPAVAARAADPVLIATDQALAEPTAESPFRERPFSETAVRFSSGDDLITLPGAAGPIPIAAALDPPPSEMWAAAAEPEALAADRADPLETEPDPLTLDPAHPFAQGTWTFQAYGAAAVGDSDKGEQFDAHIGFGYHFMEGLSFNLEGIGGWVTAERDDDGGVGGFDALLRWHYHIEDPWSLYIDGGGGFQQATTNFPGDTHFNFRGSFGIGATRRLGDGWRLMGGVRYIHISNGGVSEDNDGIDAALLYAGLMFTF